MWCRSSSASHCRQSRNQHQDTPQRHLGQWQWKQWLRCRRSPRRWRINFLQPGCLELAVEEEGDDKREKEKKEMRSFSLDLHSSLLSLFLLRGALYEKKLAVCWSKGTLIEKTLTFGFTHQNFDLFQVFLTVPKETKQQKRGLVKRLLNEFSLQHWCFIVSDSIQILLPGRAG